MIYSNISITNPWYRQNPASKKLDYANLLLKHGHLWTNKHWELEFIFDARTILRLEFSLSFRGRDHAGLELGVCILGYDLAFRIYDTRHWNHEKNTWEEQKDTNPPS